MQSRLDQFMTLLAVFAILLGNAALGFAESQREGVGTLTNVAANSPQSNQSRAAEKPESANSWQLATSSFSDTAAMKVSAESISTDGGVSKQKSPSIDDGGGAQEEFLKRIKSELDLSKSDYRQVLNTVADTKKRLETVTEDRLTLEKQLKNLDDQIAVSTEKLLLVIRQIIETENEITLLYEEIETKQVALEYQKNLLRDYITLMYKEENGLLSVNRDGSIDAFKLLLTDGSVGDSLRKWKYFDMLNVAGQQMVDRLDVIAKELQQQKKQMEGKKTKLEKLKRELIKEKEQLELQKKSKEQLLKITLGQEEVYKQLLEQTVKQQNEMVADVKALSEAMDMIQAKIASGDRNFDIEKYKSLLDYRTKVLYEFQMSSLTAKAGQFIWPVEPGRGISAYFRDPNYVGIFGVQHNAVDIPTYQGTAVRAAGDGIVYTARDNGYGYSYIILAHAGKFTTVYGHMSNILVTVGQKVAQGSIIGLSGGMPGTKGAGYMTTGPHLHFEVLLNGLYTDAMNYLPLTVLPNEKALKMPEKYKKAWEQQLIEAAKAAAGAVSSAPGF